MKWPFRLVVMVGGLPTMRAFSLFQSFSFQILAQSSTAKPGSRTGAALVALCGSRLDPRQVFGPVLPMDAV